MAKRPKKTQKSNSKLQEFVAVVFAEDMKQAQNYEALLKVNDIPSIIKEQHEHSDTAKGIVVMVPEDFFDEANVVIESQDAYDDFYDFVSEDDDSDFDGDSFDDEF